VSWNRVGPEGALALAAALAAPCPRLQQLEYAPLGVHVLLCLWVRLSVDVRVCRWCISLWVCHLRVRVRTDIQEDALAVWLGTRWAPWVRRR
jgi:hypothetical protein